MSYIKFQDIEKSFESKKVLNGIRISIEQGEFVTLLGPSGCGKTTLLRCLAGLESVDEGRIFLEREDITYTAVQKRNFSMIFQQYSLFPTMTVFNNIAYSLKMKRMEKSIINEKVFLALEMVGMVGFENKFPAQLSGGEQQRVALARSVVAESKVLLLDEPFSAIDAKLRKSLQIKIKEVHDALNLTTIFVTHDQEEAMRMSDRIYLIHDGKIEQEGTPTELYLTPKTAFAASFMGHYNLLKHTEWNQLTGLDEKEGTYAFRPEDIKLAQQTGGVSSGERYVWKGKIKRVIPQGNTIRYTVLVNHISIDVDTLFKINHQLVKDDSVYLIIEKNMIFYFEDTAD